MFVSTKGRYALRMMIQLAETSGRPVRIREIADKQDISAKYLEQIMIVLKAGGYVKSRRGPHGGYALTKHPSEYTVGSIIREMEGDLAIPCVHGRDTECEKCSSCKTIVLWEMIDDAVSGVIDKVTLEDLCNMEPKSKPVVPQ